MKINFQSLTGYKYLLLKNNDGARYIVKRLCGDTFTLEQGEGLFNFSTSYNFNGTADEVAAKIDELKLEYVGHRYGNRPFFL